MNMANHIFILKGRKRKYKKRTSQRAALGIIAEKLELYKRREAARSYNSDYTST